MIGMCVPVSFLEIGFASPFFIRSREDIEKIVEGEVCYASQNVKRVEQPLNSNMLTLHCALQPTSFAREVVCVCVLSLYMHVQMCALFTLMILKEIQVFR